VNEELMKKLEEESREIARQAREYAGKAFRERGLGGNPQDWCDIAATVLEIYKGYLEKYSPQARREIEWVEGIIDSLLWWLED